MAGVTKTSPVTYKIQHHARTEPEMVHTDKLVPCQANFDEELHSLFDEEELEGIRLLKC